MVGHQVRLLRTVACPAHGSTSLPVHVYEQGPDRAHYAFCPSALRLSKQLKASQRLIVVSILTILTMGKGWEHKIEETFHFDEDEYRREVANMRLDELQNREAVKLRQQIGAGVSLGAGIAATFLLGPAALLGVAYAGRRLDIASKKEAIVKAEIDRRNQEHYQPKKRDYFIPMGAGMVGAGLGGFLDGVTSQVASTVACHALAQHGSQAVATALAHPTMLVEGAVQGMGLQVHEMHQLLTGAVSQVSPFSTATGVYLAPGGSVASLPWLVGAQAGIPLSKGVESQVVSQVCSFATMRFKDVKTGLETQPVTCDEPGPGCKRMRDRTNALVCEHCQKDLQRTVRPFYRMYSAPFRTCTQANYYGRLLPM